MTNRTASRIIPCVRRIASPCIRVALSVSLLLTPLGCATTEIRSFSSPIPEEMRKSSHSVAVIPAGFAPSSNLLTFAKGRDTGAAKGAAAGALQGMGSLGHGGASGGPYGAAVIVLLLPVFASIGAIAGGIEGAIKAIPDEEVAKIEASVNSVLQELDMQNTMAENIVLKGGELTSYRFVPLKGPGPATPDSRPDFTTIKGEGNDLALEVSVLEIGFHGGSGSDPLLSFFMNARIRAFRVDDGAELHADIFRYTSREGKFSEWAENGALRLKEALETGYAQIAEAAIEKMFLLYEVKIDSIWSGAMHCMLEPLDPPQESLGFFSHQLNFPVIGTLHPTLKWESFPRDEDREADSTGILNSVSDITYEIKVWKGQDGVPEEVLYSRSGLPLPEHTIETPLQLETEYFWTARAHFKFDGQDRLTKWAYSRIPWPPSPDPCRENLIPLDHYHRFKITIK
jgi:hypothetical protein